MSYRPLRLHPYDLATLVRQAVESVMMKESPEFRGTIYITVENWPIKREHVSVQFREPAPKAGMKLM